MNLGRQFAFLLGIKYNKNFFSATNYADHLYQGSRSIKDPQVNNFLQSNVHNKNYDDNWNMQNTFVNEFSEWLELDFSHFDADYSAGTTQSFDSFYLRHREKKFRCYVGEYFYHLKTWISNNIDWEFITEENPLKSGDVLVISYPFCDTGNFYDITKILSDCELHNIPVLIDMAYYCLTDTPQIDFNFDCIDTISFSLSKIFPVANYRIGVRYTKKDIEDGQKLHHNINYNNYASCFIGYSLINNFSKNYIANEYRNKQQKVCEYFNLKQSDSVIFSVGDESWKKYSRETLLKEYKLNYPSDLFVNRICLNSVFENWKLFEKMTNEFNFEI